MTPTGSTGYGDPSEAFRRHLINMTESSGGLHGQVISAEGSELRRRTTKPKKSTLATDALPQPQADLPVGTSLEPSHSITPHNSRPIGTLAWSTNDRVALLARNIDVMEDELKSNGAKGLVWPQNVTYRHFFDYFTFPTLVYQLEYPRTDTLRPLVVLEKIIATFGTFSLIYLITEHYIMPFTPRTGDSLLRSFISLALPMMVNYLL